MKGTLVALDHINGRAAAALMVEGRLQDLLLSAPDGSAPTPGAIYRAIADRPLKGQGGMMLRLPDGATAFLRQGKGLRPGQALLVQVTGYAEGGKAGGYDIQGPAGAFIPWISGSFSAVRGLPAVETAQLLRAAGYPLLKGWS